MDTPTEGESPRRRTREEIREENRARHRAAMAERLAEKAERKRLEAEEAERKRRESESSAKAETPSAGAAAELAPGCDPLAPDAIRTLFAEAYRRLWAMVHDPRLTNMDVIAAFNACRMAAGIGKEAPTPTKFALPMMSLLRPTDGESDGPDDASPDSVTTSGSKSPGFGEDGSQTVHPPGGESPGNSPPGGAIPPGSTQVPPES